MGKRETTPKRTSIARNNMLILIFSFLPFMVGLSYAVMTSSNRTYLSTVINMAGSQRMRTMLIANYSQQLHFLTTEKIGSASEDSLRAVLNSELLIYERFAKTLTYGDVERKINRNPFPIVLNLLEKMNTDLAQYIATVHDLLDDSSDHEHLVAITGSAMNLKDRYHEITEKYQLLNDQMILRQKIIDIAMLLFAAAVTVSGLFLTRQIHEQEEGLIQAKLDAETANQAKSIFLANMSHEIRTPLNAVIGFSELVSSEIVDSTQKKRLSVIKSAGGSLLRLINDILDLSKIEAQRMEIVPVVSDITETCREMVSMFQLTAENKGITIHLELGSIHLPTLFLDESHLRQAVLNLISNAIKFTDKGGVRVRVERDSETEILSIQVSDTGVGIPENQLARVFESFRQTEGQNRAKYGGTGLGLPISKKLVELMGGSLTVSSEISIGTTFTISIPAPVATIVAQNQALTNNWKSYMFEGQRVLVVDDVDHNRHYLQELFAMVHLTFFEASSGAEAIEKCNNTTFDLILLDIRMPDMSGIDVFKKLKLLHSQADVPILALTASATAEEKLEIHRIGFSKYLSKPIEPLRLITELALWLTCSQSEKIVNIDVPVALTAEQQTELLQVKSFIPLLEEAIAPVDFASLESIAARLIECTSIPEIISFSKSLLNNLNNCDITELSESAHALTYVCKNLSKEVQHG